MDTFTMRAPDDFHVHLRQDTLLESVIGATAGRFKRAVIMPNTNPPILTAEDAERYKSEIIHVALQQGFTNFTPLMTIKLTSKTTPEIIQKAKKAGVIAGKLLPEGVTTGSEDGVSDIKSMYPIFKVMEEEDLPLSVHGEQPGITCLGAEKAFLPSLALIVNAFPRLKIILEHVSTVGAVYMVMNLPDTVAATITAHHLFLTFDDVIGSKSRPHNFCRPIANTARDREALIQIAISGNPKFLFGSDTAPHLITNKECAVGSPGIFTAPVALQLLTEKFESRAALDKLENFTSRFGAEFYGLPLNEGEIAFRRESMKIPEALHGISIFRAGETLQWQCQSRR